MARDCHYGRYSIWKYDFSFHIAIAHADAIDLFYKFSITLHFKNQK